MKKQMATWGMLISEIPPHTIHLLSILLPTQSHATKFTMPPYRLHDTPQRAKAQGAREYCIAKGIPYDEREISAIFDLPERTGYRILAKGASSRSTPTSQGLTETRGRKTKLSGADVREADHLLEERGLGFEAKGMSWDAVAFELDFKVTGRTLATTLRMALGYSHYRAALVKHLSDSAKEARVNFACTMLLKYPDSPDWYRVRFSNEMHAGYGPEGQMWIIRKQGISMRYRPDNVQERDPPPEKIGLECIAGLQLVTISNPLLYSIRFQAITTESSPIRLISSRYSKWKSRSGSSEGMISYSKKMAIQATE